MKSLFKRSLPLVALLLLAALAFGGVKSGPTKGGLYKPEVLNAYKFLDINQINCTINSDGVYADYRRTSSSGLEWPKGTGQTAIYTAGMWLAGKHRPTGLIRTAVMDYASEYQPGPLMETYDATANDDTGPVGRNTDNKYRLYKISKSDMKTGAAYNADLAEWPGDLGAPYIDNDGDGQWTAGVDEPKFYGDQQIWCVVNDVNKSRHAAVGTTSPMGIEVRCLYFAFAQQGPLGNMLFFKWQIINKSNADYDSAYISMWSDPDMGYADDDLPGCDTTLSLGYIYNETNNDTKYGSPPPACGFSFFEGPKVPGTATDSAIVDGQWIKGYRNLPMASFVVYVNGTFAQLQDPPATDPTFPEICYDYMRGMAGTVHQLLYSTLNPGQPYLKWFSGDPVAGTGELPGDFPLGTFKGIDIRVMQSAGPFTLAQGDTQEVVGAFLIAKGNSNLNSITVLKANAMIAQDAFNSNFIVPSAPPMPTVKVAQLPNKLIFDWYTGSDVTESYNYKGNKFEGYNFYQGESQAGPWTRIATWDIRNGISLIWDYVTDEASGATIFAPTQYGTDTSAMTHLFIAEQDYLENTALVNGKEYFFALTTYSYNHTPGILGTYPMALEQPTVPIANAIPREPSVGTAFTSSPGQVFSTSRPGDDALLPEVVSPPLLTGLTYTASINGTGRNLTGWDVVRQNKSGTVDTLVKGCTNFTGDNLSPIVDGVILRLREPDPGVRRDTQTPNGYRYSPAANTCIIANTYVDAIKMQSGIGAYYPISGVTMSDLGGRGSKITSDHLKKVEIRFNSAQTQHAYRYLRNVTTLPNKPAQDSSFIPYILVKGNGFVYQRDYATITVPFTVWEVDSLDGDPAPRQLNIGFLENNDSLKSRSGEFKGLGRINGKWDPTTAASGGMEALYIYASTYADTAKSAYTVNIFAQDSLDIYYVLWPKATTSTATFTDGDRITITPNYSLNGGRQYSYLPPAPTVNDATLGANQLGDLNVFPNPYFGHNKAETGSVYSRFVTFSHLPDVARIRIYTITGDLVRDIEHSNQTTFEQWDLRNTHGLPVASGVYFAHIDIPGMGTRILKVAIIQPEERPSRI